MKKFNFNYHYENSKEIYREKKSKNYFIMIKCKKK